MAIRIFIAAAVLLLAALAPVPAQERSSSGDMAIARQLYQRSPVKRFTDNVGDAIGLMVANMQNRNELRYRQELQMIRDTLNSAFYPAILHAKATEHLARMVAQEPDHAANVAEWLRLPATIRVREADTGSGDDEAQEKFYEGIDFDADTTIERMQLLLEVQKAEGLAEHSIENAWLLTNLFRRIANATIAIPRGESTLPMVNEQLREGMIEHTESMLLVQRLYLYRELAEEDLVNYRLFFDTKAGRWYSGAVTRAIGLAYAETARELGARMNIGEK